MRRPWLRDCTSEQIVALIELKQRFEDLTVEEFLDRCGGPCGENSIKPYVSFVSPNGLFYGIERDGNIHT